MNTLLLVGGELCQRTAALLDRAQWRCLGLRRRAMGDAADDDSIIWHQGDLADPESLAVLAKGPLAQATHVLYAPAPSTREPQSYADVYSEGLPRLLAAFAPEQRSRLQRVVLVGSTVVWGGSDAWVDETTPMENSNFRAAGVVGAIEALQSTLPAPVGVAVCPSGLYGPGRTRVVQGLREGTTVAPEGPGHWANRLHIDDAARACVHLLTLADPEPLYIATDDTPMPTAELYDAIAPLAGGPSVQRESRPGSGKRLSNARLRGTGWAPRWPDTVEGYRALIEAEAPSTSHPNEGLSGS